MTTRDLVSRDSPPASCTRHIAHALHTSRRSDASPARPRWLLTEPGLGYRFQPNP
jgi:hypothetical protein